MASTNMIGSSVDNSGSGGRDGGALRDLGDARDAVKDQMIRTGVVPMTSITTTTISTMKGVGSANVAGISPSTTVISLAPSASDITLFSPIVEVRNPYAGLGTLVETKQDGEGSVAEEGAELDGYGHSEMKGDACLGGRLEGRRFSGAEEDSDTKNEGEISFGSSSLSSLPSDYSHSADAKENEGGNRAYDTSEEEHKVVEDSVQVSSVLTA